MVAPTCFGITLPSSGSVPSVFWEMLNWGAVHRILWMGVLCLVACGVVRGDPDRHAQAQVTKFAAHACLLKVCQLQ
jgi:hypothetical protein